jgi:hypothetical protein
MSGESKPVAGANKGNGKLIGRIVVYALLGVAVVVVGMDYVQKQNAVKTAQMLLDRKEASDKGELRYEESKTLFQGTPTIERINKRPGKHAALFTEVLTWKGPINEHSITLYLGLPLADPALNWVEGPGKEPDSQPEPAPAAQPAGTPAAAAPETTPEATPETETDGKPETTPEAEAVKEPEKEPEAE